MHLRRPRGPPGSTEIRNMSTVQAEQWRGRYWRSIGTCSQCQEPAIQLFCQDDRRPDAVLLIRGCRHIYWRRLYRLAILGLEGRLKRRGTLVASVADAGRLLHPTDELHYRAMVDPGGWCQRRAGQHRLDEISANWSHNRRACGKCWMSCRAQKLYPDHGNGNHAMLHTLLIRIA